VRPHRSRDYEWEFHLQRLSWKITLIQKKPHTLIFFNIKFISFFFVGAVDACYTCFTQIIKDKADTLKKAIRNLKMVQASYIFRFGIVNFKIASCYEISKIEFTRKNRYRYITLWADRHYILQIELITGKRLFRRGLSSKLRQRSRCVITTCLFLKGWRLGGRTGARNSVSSADNATSRGHGTNLQTTEFFTSLSYCHLSRLFNHPHRRRKFWKLKKLA